MRDFPGNNTRKITSLGKLSTKEASLCLNSFLWIAVLLVATLVTFCSVYFPIFITSKSLTTSLIISGISVLLVIAKFTNQGRKAWNFLLGTRSEIRKVVWPTRQETINTTIIVLVIIAIASVLIYFMGLLFTYMIHWILK